MNENNSSGINIDLGNQCSKNAYSWAKKTFVNRYNLPGMPISKVDGSFSNEIDFNGVKIGITSDGIGTKIEIAERLGIYDTLGFDLVAMVVDDLICSGFEPANLSNILDVDYLDYSIVDQLMNGLYQAANFAKIAVTGGEIAELGNRICGYGKNMHFNWCATAIGILSQKLNYGIDGSNIKVGDAIISLESASFRSNGYSLLRKILKHNYGNEWHEYIYKNNKHWGDVLLTPSQIYSPTICKLIQSDIKINGIAHITGGGIIDNFKRILKCNKFGAELNDIHNPLDFMLDIQKLGNVDEEQAYTIWNMGNGMLIVVDDLDKERAIDIINKDKYNSKIAGKIINKSIIELHTKGNHPQIIISPVE